MTTTHVQNAAFIVAWNPTENRHEYRTNADLVFTGTTITHLGPLYTGPADTVIDGRHLMLMPGLVDIHSHPSLEPLWRGLREEHGVPEMFMSGLYERSQAFRPDLAARQAAKQVAYCEMLLCGITTVADLSSNDEGWIDTAAASGLRVYLAPGYASARWKLEGHHRLAYDWDIEAGKRGMDAALALIAEAQAHPSNRLAGIVSPAQIDTCTEELLRDSQAAATEKNLPLTTHCAQGVNEFREMVARHGVTPIQWAHRIGFLGPLTTLGHAIFTDEHSWIRWHTKTDIHLLADTGTSVAHNPTPFARYGHMLEDFGRYRRQGINMAIGTDVAPHNLIEEMRLAALTARIAARDIHTVGTADIFHAATIGGAKSLGREDIGRLAIGAKADLVLIDLQNPWMRPAIDPLRCLIYTASDRAIHSVYVDGHLVMTQGRVLTLDHENALATLAEAQSRMIEDVPTHDFRARTADEITPRSLPTAPT